MHGGMKGSEGEVKGTHGSLAREKRKKREGEREKGKKRGEKRGHK